MSLACIACSRAAMTAVVGSTAAAAASISYVCFFVGLLVDYWVMINQMNFTSKVGRATDASLGGGNVRVVVVRVILPFTFSLTTLL